MFGTIGDKAAHAENKNHDVIHTVADPIYDHGGLAVLHGNIGTDSAIVKFSAVDPAAWKFSGPAKCYDSQDDAWHAILKDEIVAGDVVIIRYEGPKARPVCPIWKPLWRLCWARGWAVRLPWCLTDASAVPPAVLRLVMFPPNLRRRQFGIDSGWGYGVY